ncbi:MAG: GxxExxY protein [Bacteroidales bacterium]|jgi:GxxExxY protein|nr:GxxExxY protein [Bacteroidales bacterium]
MAEILYKEESYEIIGKCMQVHRELGNGFLEIVYKDALEYLFQKYDIPYEREKEYVVQFEDVILPHKFYADFVVYDKIILEVKAVKDFTPEHFAQTINYLKVSDNQLGLLVNFGKASFESKRFLNEY